MRSTQLIHHPYRPPASFDAVPVGVFKASTVFFPNVAAMRSRDWKNKSAYTYGLHGTPTTFTLEERIAHLEQGSHCVLAPSGLAAIALVDMAFLRSGDELLIPHNAYGPNKSFAQGELISWGISPCYYDPMNPADLAARISPATRLVWLEAAGSVTLEFPDVPALVGVVQAANEGRQRPILTALDNTWGAGVAFSAFDLGADMAMQALTKYPSGGADVLMGSVVTRDETLHRQLLLTHMRLGLGVGVNDAELLLRGLPSIELRYRQQDHSARELAAWMQSQKGVARVFHPALPGSPGHSTWCRDASGAAALFTVVFDDEIPTESLEAFCDRLQLFRLGYSWAGPVSLCVPYEHHEMRGRDWIYRHGPVRFAVGLEATEDLRADLKQALEVVSV